MTKNDLLKHIDFLVSIQDNIRTESNGIRNIAKEFEVQKKAHDISRECTSAIVSLRKLSTQLYGELKNE